MKITTYESADVRLYLERDGDEVRLCAKTCEQGWTLLRFAESESEPGKMAVHSVGGIEDDLIETDEHGQVEIYGQYDE